MPNLTTNFSFKKPVSTDLIDPTSNEPSDLNGNMDTLDSHLAQDGLWRPSRAGLIAQTQPLEYSNNATGALTTQLFYVAAMECHTIKTCTGIILNLAAGAGTTGRTHSQIRAYNGSGTLLGNTTDGTTTSGIWGSSAGRVKIAWSSTFSTINGVIYILLWDVSTGTVPSFQCLTTSGGQNAALLNDPVNATATNVTRWGSFSAGSSSAAPGSLSISGSGVVSIASNTGTARADCPWLALY
jgi:hypothetical protein